MRKESWIPLVGSSLVFYFSPIFSLTLVLFIWLLFPFLRQGLFMCFGVLFFFCLRRLNVYPILRRGWASNCKYTILGSLRRVAQIVSYEIRLILLLLCLIWLRGSYNLHIIIKNQSLIYNIFIISYLALIWFITCLAETNRTPYDFSEGESELVSGFNTEYIGGGFTLIFLSEYARILFISVIRVILFFRSKVSLLYFRKILIIGYLFIWVRATLPRYRYDKLINLAWKSLLPWVLRFVLFIRAIIFFL